jgi:hypothetical protein
MSGGLHSSTTGGTGGHRVGLEPQGGLAAGFGAELPGCANLLRPIGTEYFWANTRMGGVGSIIFILNLYIFN